MATFQKKNQDFLYLAAIVVTPQLQRNHAASNKFPSSKKDSPAPISTHWFINLRDSSSSFQWKASLIPQEGRTKWEKGSRRKGKEILKSGNGRGRRWQLLHTPTSSYTPHTLLDATSKPEAQTKNISFSVGGTKATKNIHIKKQEEYVSLSQERCI